MRFSSFQALSLFLALPAHGFPNPPFEDGALAPLVQRDLQTAQTLSFSKKNEALLNTGLQGNNANVFCVDCTASTTVDVDVGFNPPKVDLLDLGSFDPGDLTFTLKFTETKAHLDLKISATGEAVLPIRLFTLQSPIGLSDPTGILTIGIIPTLDLVFDVSAGVDVQGGIDLAIPNGSFIRFNVGGDIVDEKFTGTIATSIPWKATSGNATLKADLRLRVQAGVDLGFPIDLTALVGADANLIEAVVGVQSNPSAPCTLEVTESFNVNAGAYVELDVELGPGDDSLGPTATTTFFNGPTLSQCLGSSASTKALESGSSKAGSTASTSPPTKAISTPCSSGGSTSTSASQLKSELQTAQSQSSVTKARSSTPCCNSMTALPTSVSTTGACLKKVTTVTNYVTVYG